MNTEVHVIIPPEYDSVGYITDTYILPNNAEEYFLCTDSLDLPLASLIINSNRISAVIVESGDFSDHARKMLQESGIGLLVHPNAKSLKDTKCLLNEKGLTILSTKTPISAICSKLNKKNLDTYKKFGINSLGYFRFKFCLFQLFSQEQDSYGNDERIEEYLLEHLSELGTQHWSSIRCVLSDLTSAELAEVGISVNVETNPDMGFRGPRNISQWIPELNAIRKFQEKYNTNIKICAPFISSTEEYKSFVALVEKVGIDRKSVDLGFTLEVPALAEELDELFSSKEVNFMAIGTSDLFALFNGIDRNNRLLSITPTTNANISLMNRIVNSAKKYNIHTFVCGEVRRNKQVMNKLMKVGIGELISSARFKDIASVFQLSSTFEY